jgi:hypothetical protein
MGNKASSPITTEDIQNEFRKRLEDDRRGTRGYSNAPMDHLLAVRRWKHLRKRYPDPDWYDYHPNKSEKFSCAKITHEELEYLLAHHVKSVKKKSRKPVKKKSRKPVKKKSRKPVKKKSRKRKSKFRVRKDRIFEKHGLLGDDKMIRKQKVPTLPQIIYNYLPYHLKIDIHKDPDKYKELASVINNLHTEMMEVHAKKIRPKLKLTTRGLKLINILQGIYNHIISHPPYPNHSGEDLDDGDVNYTLNAWDDFSSTNYPEYDLFEEKVIKWPKFLFLIYYTYKMSYRKYYNLDQGPTMRDYELPFNLHNNLMTYIYKTFNHLNESISLKDFRYYGY